MRETLLKALEHYPVFTVKDIAGALDKERNYASLVAYRLKKRGAIREIEKGKYCLEDDALLVASWIVWPSYVTSWAALNYYGLTDQLPFAIHVATTRKRKNKTVSFGNARIEFIKISGKMLTGFHRATYRGKQIFVAEKEKAIIDALAAKKMSIAEAVEVVKKNKRRLNRNKIFSFAKNVNGLTGKLKTALAK